MQLIGGGVISLLLFLAWLGVTLRQALHARARVSGPLAGMALAFAVGCLFNSMLLDFVEGHFYIALLAWLLAENRYAPQQDGRSAGVERILVIATRQIGDVLLTTPLDPGRTPALAPGPHRGSRLPGDAGHAARQPRRGRPDRVAAPARLARPADSCPQALAALRPGARHRSGRPGAPAGMARVEPPQRDPPGGQRQQLVEKTAAGPCRHRCR